MRINLGLMDSLASSIKQKQKGFNFVICTSGAVQLGANG